ncbi:MAG: hypothetical protein Q9169_002579 [Polycauliona sp. 2 TL-2023]
MLSFLSLSVQALVLSSLWSTVFGREHQLRAKRLEDVIEQEQSVDKRGICYDDDTYESFKYWIVDSAPYCSSLLGLVDNTRTVSRVSRTTTTTVSVNFVTRTATTTVPAVTEISTIFTPALNRREAAPATTVAPNFYEENPYAYSMGVGDAVNASIASSVYSACSCLSLQPSDVDETSVILACLAIFPHLQYIIISLSHFRFIRHPTYSGADCQLHEGVGTESNTYDFCQLHDHHERQRDITPKRWFYFVSRRKSEYLTRFFWLPRVRHFENFFAAFFQLPNPFFKSELVRLPHHFFKPELWA